MADGFVFRRESGLFGRCHRFGPNRRPAAVEHRRKSPPCPHPGESRVAADPRSDDRQIVVQAEQVAKAPERQDARVEGPRRQLSQDAQVVAVILDPLAPFVQRQDGAGALYFSGGGEHPAVSIAQAGLQRAETVGPEAPVGDPQAEFQQQPVRVVEPARQVFAVRGEHCKPQPGYAGADRPEAAPVEAPRRRPGESRHLPVVDRQGDVGVAQAGKGRRDNPERRVGRPVQAGFVQRAARQPQHGAHLLAALAQGVDRFRARHGIVLDRGGGTVELFQRDPLDRVGHRFRREDGVGQGRVGGR